MKKTIESIVEDTKNGKAVTIVANSFVDVGAFHIFRSALMELKAWEEYHRLGYLDATIYENTEHRLRLIVLPARPGDDGYTPDMAQPSKEYMQGMVLRYVNDSDKVYMLQVGVNIVG